MIAHAGGGRKHRPQAFWRWLRSHTPHAGNCTFGKEAKDARIVVAEKGRLAVRFIQPQSSPDFSVAKGGVVRGFVQYLCTLGH